MNNSTPLCKLLAHLNTLITTLNFTNRGRQICKKWIPFRFLSDKLPCTTYQRYTLRKTDYDLKSRVGSKDWTCLDCQGVMTPSSGPPINTSFLILRKFFFHSATTKHSKDTASWQFIRYPCTNSCNGVQHWTLSLQSYCLSCKKKLNDNFSYYSDFPGTIFSYLPIHVSRSHDEVNMHPLKVTYTELMDEFYPQGTC